MKAAIYSRKSKFTGKGESIENQIDLCKEYCSKYGIAIHEIYEDEGFSGGNTDRPHFQKMLKDAKKKKFNVIVCYRLDRISRNIADFSTLIDDLQDLGIDFVSIREQFDTSTPMGRAMMYIASVFAQLERETIAERIKDNMNQLARTGRWLGGKTPLGFKSKQINYVDENMKERKMFNLYPIEDELKLVKHIYDKYIELGSLSTLESYFLIEGIKTRTNRKYDMSTLKFILTNPVYAVADDLFYEYCIKHNMDIASSKEDFDGSYSVMVYNKTDHKGNRITKKSHDKWIVAIANHKGIIPSKQWIQVQNKIQSNADKSPRTGTSKIALLSTLLVCSKCGSKMRIQGKYKDGELQQHYYKCRLKERSHGKLCDMKNLNGTLAEETVINEIKKLAFSKNVMTKEIESRKKNLEKENKNSDYEKDKLIKQLREKENAIENLTIQLSQNSSSAAASYIIKQIEKLDKELKNLKLTLSNIEENKESNLIKQMNIDILKNNILKIAQNSDTMSFEERRKLLHSIIKKIDWDGKKLKIELFEAE